MYYLWHITRMGYLTTNGTTTTQLNEAGTFTEASAISKVRLSKDHQGEPIILPIAASVIRDAL